MKTCNIKGNIREIKTPMDFQTFVRELMSKNVIKAAEGVLVMGMFNLGHLMVQVDGEPFLEVSELPE